MKAVQRGRNPLCIESPNCKKQIVKSAQNYCSLSLLLILVIFIDCSGYLCWSKRLPIHQRLLRGLPGQYLFPYSSFQTEAQLCSGSACAQFSSPLAWRIPRGMPTGGLLLAYSSLQETVSGPGWAHSLRGPTFLERIDIPHMKERFLSQFQQTWTRRHVVPAADGSSIVTERGTGLRMKLQQRMAKQRGRR